MLSQFFSLFAVQSRDRLSTKIPRLHLFLMLAWLISLPVMESIAHAAVPVNTSLSPSPASSLTGVAKTFTAVYSDSSGASHITQARLLINSSASATGGLCATYDTGTNLLNLYADDGTTLVGSHAPGSAFTISNSQGSLNCATTTVTTSGSNLTVKWSFTPSSTFTGSKNVYLWVTNPTSTVGYTDLGDWVISSSNAAPTLSAVTPSPVTSLINVAQSFTAVYTDTNGVADISQAQLLVSASAASTANTLCGVYLHSNNKLYLYAANGTTLIGAYAPGTVGATITNSQGTLDCEHTTVTESGNTLTVNWNFTPSSTYTGAKNLYGLAFDNASSRVGYSDLGDWTINLPNVAPTNGTVSPNPVSSNMGSATAITTTYSDANGASDLSNVYFLANTTASGANALYARYDKANNLLWLRNDADSSWLGGFAPGSFNTITNSQGTLNCAAISVSSSGNTLSVTWNLTPTNFAGDTNVWLSAIDLSGLQSTFTDLGDWSIVGATSIGYYDGTHVVFSYNDEADSNTLGDGVINAGLSAGVPQAILLMTNASCSGAGSGGRAEVDRTPYSRKVITWTWNPVGSQPAPSVQPSYGFPMILTSTSAVAVSGDPATHAKTQVTCSGTVYQDGAQINPDVMGTDVSSSNTYNGTPSIYNATYSPVFNTGPRVQGPFVSNLFLSVDSEMELVASGTNSASASVSINAGMADVLLDWEF